MLHTFRTIAKYERKVLLRSWFFRIFSGLSLFVLFGFNMGEISEVGDMRWVYRAVASNIPYADLFILNIAQAIIAVFLSSEFIKRDRKQDTAEVFYVRSMGNLTYVMAKCWSIISIFLLVNAVGLGMGLVFNLLAADTRVDWQAYLYYPALISIPTLLFIVGLSGLFMSIIRNQAITFVLLLGYIFTSMLYLGNDYNYLFDYMAFHLPLFHSDIVGFGDWEQILRLRSMYAAFGIALIALTALLLRRLKQSPLQNALAALLALSGLAAGGFQGKVHLDEYQRQAALPEQMIALNNQYVQAPKIDIQEYRLELEQDADHFSVTSRMHGVFAEEANEFVLRLNPGLEVHEITSPHGSVNFERKLHLLLLRFAEPPPPDSTILLTIRYSGKIDQAACYPDIDRDQKYPMEKQFIFDLGRQYAFTSPRFLLLTEESNWYPIAGVGYSTTDPSWFRKDFIDFELSVKTLPGLRPVAYGDIRETGANSFQILPEHALTRMALAIGEYEKSTLKTDSLEFSAYYLKGHDYFAKGLPDIQDTLPKIIVERLRDFERKSGLEYPHRSFSLVEVPGQFKSYDRTWTSLHETNQPSMVFIPERGLHTRNFDFNGSVKRQKRWNSRRNMTPEEIQIRVLYAFLGEFYRFKNVSTRSNNRRVVVRESINPYAQFAQFYELCNNLDAEEWPVMNRVLESYLQPSGQNNQDWTRQNAGATQYEQANMVLQDKSFAEALLSIDKRDLIDNIIELKGDLLFSTVEANTEEGEFAGFLQKLLKEYRFRNLPFDVFVSRLQNEFGLDLGKRMPGWFRESELPRYLVQTPIAEKVLSGDQELVRIRYAMANEGAAEGVVKVSIRTEDALDKLLYLAPGQAKSVSYLLPEEPQEINFNLLVSGNLPNQLEYNFDQIPETKVINATAAEIILPGEFSFSDNNREIIVDNEHGGFAYSEYEEMSRLRKWLKPAQQDDFKYKGSIIWRPPLNWTPTTNDRLFGEFIRSAYYIKAGDGSKEAYWKVPLRGAGRYDVFYHVYKDVSFRWNRNQKGSYQFVIPHDSGTDRPTLELTRQIPDGWFRLGDYYFSSDTVTVTLTNESRLRAVFADAVKFVKID